MQETAIEDKVLDALREFAGVVGETAETLWPMAVEATWAKSFSALVVCCFGILFAAAMALVAHKVAKKYEQGSEVRMVIGTVVPIAGVIIVFAAVMNVAVWLPGLIAPEGITLMELLK